MVIYFVCSNCRFGMCSRSSRYRSGGLLFFLSRTCSVTSLTVEAVDCKRPPRLSAQLLVLVEFATCQRIRLRRFILCTKSCSVCNNIRHASSRSTIRNNNQNPMYIILYVPNTLQYACTSPSLTPSRPSSRKRPTPPTAHHRIDRLTRADAKTDPHDIAVT